MKKKKLKETLLAKEAECRRLEQQVRTVENRWKSNARDPQKITAKSIMLSLQLKSLNEQAVHKYRTLTTFSWYKRDCINAETITDICNT